MVEARDVVVLIWTCALLGDMQVVRLACSALFVILEWDACSVALIFSDIGTGVTTYSLHPGVIRTELGRHFWPTIPLWKKVLYKPFSFFIKNPTEGAQTTIYCAVEKSLENESGLYYSDCARKATAPQGCDDEVAKKLWDLSASMVGLTQSE